MIFHNLSSRKKAMFQCLRLVGYNLIVDERKWNNPVVKFPYPLNTSVAFRWMSVVSSRVIERGSSLLIETRSQKTDFYPFYSRQTFQVLAVNVDIFHVLGEAMTAFDIRGSERVLVICGHQRSELHVSHRIQHQRCFADPDFLFNHISYLS